MLHNVPLAITLAADNYTSGEPIEGLLSRLSKKPWLRRESKEKTAVSNVLNNVIKKLNDKSKNLFYLLSVLPPDDIPRRLLDGMFSSEVDCNKSLMALKNASVITVGRIGGSNGPINQISIHREIQELIFQKLKDAYFYGEYEYVLEAIRLIGVNNDYPIQVRANLLLYQLQRYKGKSWLAGIFYYIKRVFYLFTFAFLSYVLLGFVGQIFDEITGCSFASDIIKGLNLQSNSNFKIDNGKLFSNTQFFTILISRLLFFLSPIMLKIIVDKGFSVFFKLEYWLQSSL